ncbi:hypothetical protein AMTRI_Chr10g3720 [Amborella trichopoda]
MMHAAGAEDGVNLDVPQPYNQLHGDGEMEAMVLAPALPDQVVNQVEEVASVEQDRMFNFTNEQVVAMLDDMGADLHVPVRVVYDAIRENVKKPRKNLNDKGSSEAEHGELKDTKFAGKNLSSKGKETASKPTRW